MQAFQLGYKCTRKFHKPLYIWDHIERVSMTEAAARQEEREGGGEEEAKSPVPGYLSIVSRINGLASIGKDEKVRDENDKRRLCICIHTH